MSHYRSNVRDVEFNLFEVLGLDALLDSGAYGELDTATVREILGEVARLSEGPIADSFVDGDRNPPGFLPAEHTITVPDSVRRSVTALKDSGWLRIGMSEIEVAAAGDDRQGGRGERVLRTLDHVALVAP